MIDINPGILFVQIITFLIALFIVWKIAWGPLIAMMKKREDDIRADIEKAKTERESAEVLKQKYETELAQTQAEAQRRIIQAAEEGDKQKKELIRAANTEADKILADARQELLGEKKRLMQELRADVADLAVQISEKLMREKLDKTAKDKALKEAIGDISGAEGRKH